MKKILSVLLCVLLLFTATACEEDTKPTVFDVTIGFNNDATKFAKTFKRDVHVYDKTKPIYLWKYNGKDPDSLRIAARQSQYSLINRSNEFQRIESSFDLSTENEDLSLIVFYGYMSEKDEDQGIVEYYEYLSKKGSDLSKQEKDGGISKEEINSVLCDVLCLTWEDVAPEKITAGELVYHTYKFASYTTVLETSGYQLFMEVYSYVEEGYACTTKQTALEMMSTIVKSLYEVDVS